MYKNYNELLEIHDKYLQAITADYLLLLLEDSLNSQDELS